jgi:Flp pilus assembly protein TadG
VRTFRPKLTTDESGNLIIEAAVCLPILFLISLGVIQLLLFLASYIGATYGARAAVRYAAVHGAASITPCTAANLTAIVSTYAIGIPSSSIQVTPTWSPSNAVGSTVSVQVSLSWATGIPVDTLGTVTAATTAQGIILQ